LPRRHGNVVCTERFLLAITNCLNFGNPYSPRCIGSSRKPSTGMGEACRAYRHHLLRWNVSFYNESPTASVFPTPVIGMLGLIEDLRHVTGARFRSAGDVIMLIGRTEGHIGGSEYLALEHGQTTGDAPPIDLEFEKKVQRACLEGIASGYIRSAHDCSEGGLACSGRVLHA